MSRLFCAVFCGLLIHVVLTTGQRQAQKPTIDAELPLRIGDEKRPPQLWPNAKVPWKISSAVVDIQKINLIKQVIKDIESNTCIRFPAARRENEYMNIQTDRFACSSQIGVQTGINQLNLADSCWDYATIAHQILHVLGLYHENNRADRDDYVEINLENLRGLNARKFDKLPRTQYPVLDVPYDLNSLTHFPTQIYGMKKGPRDWTIRSRRDPQKELGNNHISLGDYKKLKKLYRC